MVCQRRLARERQRQTERVNKIMCSFGSYRVAALARDLKGRVTRVSYL